jgi:Fe-Mn family superoxide dismutase
MAFTLPELRYDHDALEAAIDAETMRLHHGKHHRAYVDKLNEGVAEDPSLEGRSLEEILATISSQPAKVRNNGGGHWNHSFFWETMGPESGRPTGRFTVALEEAFGSVDEFKDKFEAAGVNRFGSGWAWLVLDGSGTLVVTSTPNQDNPLMDVAPVRGTPLLGNDVWEHAYYLRYNNRRADYLKAWWDVVDWEKVAERYEQALG